MKIEPKAYFKGIEKKLIDEIREAKSSVKIAMAWFTNNTIKGSLIEIKEKNNQIQIIIVVDDNEINNKYFLNYKSNFEEVGIKIKEKTSNRFFHHKFMVIDEFTTITGSYNYSKKANSNLENIVVIKDEDFSSFYSRVFEFLTVEDYIDENVQILIKNPKFAQEIFSTYYSFSKSEYHKYKDKILIGDCFTHGNGLYDELSYIPGLIFNPKISLSDYKKSDFFEFDIPVNKEMIKNWTKWRNTDLILESFRGDEDRYHLINDELDKNSEAVEEYFKRKMEKTYRYEKLNDIVKNGVDIILEDDLWLNNFEPFLNKKLTETIFMNMEKVEKRKENWW